MQYSVYDHGSRLYTYYEDGRTEGTHAGAPTILATGKIGVPPEAGAWRLPMGARKTGTGELPRGRIASRGGVALAAADLGDPGRLVIAGVLAYIAWRSLR